MKRLIIAMLAILSSVCTANAQGLYISGTTGGSVFDPISYTEGTMQMWETPTNCSGGQCTVKSYVQLSKANGVFFRAGLIWASTLCPAGKVAAFYYGTNHAQTYVGCVNKTDYVRVKLVLTTTGRFHTTIINSYWYVNGVLTFSDTAGMTGFAVTDAVKCPGRIEVWHGSGPQPAPAVAVVFDHSCVGPAPGDAYFVSPAGNPYAMPGSTISAFNIYMD